MPAGDVEATPTDGGIGCEAEESRRVTKEPGEGERLLTRLLSTVESRTRGHERRGDELLQETGRRSRQYSGFRHSSHPGLAGCLPPPWTCEIVGRKPFDPSPILLGLLSDRNQLPPDTREDFWRVPLASNPLLTGRSRRSITIRRIGAERGREHGRLRSRKGAATRGRGERTINRRAGAAACRACDSSRSGRDGSDPSRWHP